MLRIERVIVKAILHQVGIRCKSWSPLGELHQCHLLKLSLNNKELWNSKKLPNTYTWEGHHKMPRELNSTQTWKSSLSKTPTPLNNKSPKCLKSSKKKPAKISCEVVHLPNSWANLKSIMILLFQITPKNQLLQESQILIGTAPVASAIGPRTQAWFQDHLSISKAVASKPSLCRKKFDKTLKFSCLRQMSGN